MKGENNLHSDKSGSRTEVHSMGFEEDEGTTHEVQKEEKRMESNYIKDIRQK